MHGISQCKQDCWQKRPEHRFSLVQSSTNPRAELETFVSYGTVLKDWSMPIAGMKGKLCLHGDELGDGRDTQLPGEQGGLASGHQARVDAVRPEGLHVGRGQVAPVAPLVPALHCHA